MVLGNVKVPLDQPINQSLLQDQWLDVTWEKRAYSCNESKGSLYRHHHSEKGRAMVPILLMKEMASGLRF